MSRLGAGPEGDPAGAVCLPHGDDVPQAIEEVGVSPTRFDILFFTFLAVATTPSFFKLLTPRTLKRKGFVIFHEVDVKTS